jgi:bifunctional ADP-heptose synthase (sugar kinase/adenylyltransferase)
MVNQRQKPFKILLIGDSCYDDYHYGSINRISPEAPVPVLDMDRVVTKKGMAFNVFNNVLALGAEAHIVTEFSERKHRYLDSKTGQQLLRVDEKIPRHIVDDADKEINEYDAIIVSDYNKGFFNEEDILEIISKYAGPIFVDTKKRDLSIFDGCFVKINQYEYDASTRLTEELIVTYGSKKVEYNNKTYTPPKVEAFDVCGAGDTFLAALAYKYCEDLDMDEAIKFAMIAASLTVQHIGVYAPTLEEINNAA